MELKKLNLTPTVMTSLMYTYLLWTQVMSIFLLFNLVPGFHQNYAKYNFFIQQNPGQYTRVEYLRTSIQTLRCCLIETTRLHSSGAKTWSTMLTVKGNGLRLRELSCPKHLIGLLMIRQCLCQVSLIWVACELLELFNKLCTSRL